MRTAMATPTTDTCAEQRRELELLLRRFETGQREDLAALCGTAGASVQQLAERGQVPGYLTVDPADPAPVVERTVFAALRRLSAAAG